MTIKITKNRAKHKFPTLTWRVQKHIEGNYLFARAVPVGMFLASQRFTPKEGMEPEQIFHELKEKGFKIITEERAEYIYFDVEYKDGEEPPELPKSPDSFEEMVKMIKEGRI